MNKANKDFLLFLIFSKFTLLLHFNINERIIYKRYKFEGLTRSRISIKIINNLCS